MARIMPPDITAPRTQLGAALGVVFVNLRLVLRFFGRGHSVDPCGESDIKPLYLCVQGRVQIRDPDDLLIHGVHFVIFFNIADAFSIIKCRDAVRYFAKFRCIDCESQTVRFNNMGNIFVFLIHDNW